MTTAEFSGIRKGSQLVTAEKCAYQNRENPKVEKSGESKIDLHQRNQAIFPFKNSFINFEFESFDLSLISFFQKILRVIPPLSKFAGISNDLTLH
jgi:hypothetical protein